MVTPIRHLAQALLTHVQRLREAIILLGARQVGKTTLVRRLFPEAHYVSLDNESARSILDRYDLGAYTQLIPPGTQLCILDELHLLKDPGRAAKIIYDHMPNVRLIVTGSSSFWIKNRATESLAGRKIDYHLYPLSMSEYLVQTGIERGLAYPILRHINAQPNFPPERIYPFDVITLTEAAMRYGLYPAVTRHPQKETYLRNLVDSVVFRDLLELSLIENRSAARNLLRLLAYQIGSLVNVRELASRLGIDVKTVRRYLTLFEQSFITFSLPPYTHSRRKEIGKMTKVYFYDCGLRNALIENFQPMEIRADAGALFENLVIAEAVKANTYGTLGYRLHFWRTTEGSEIDLVLARDNELVGLEIKHSPRRRVNRAFLHRYPHAQIATMTPKNYL